MVFMAIQQFRAEFGPQYSLKGHALFFCFSRLSLHNSDDGQPPFSLSTLPFPFTIPIHQSLSQGFCASPTSPFSHALWFLHSLYMMAGAFCALHHCLLISCLLSLVLLSLLYLLFIRVLCVPPILPHQSNLFSFCSSEYSFRM